MIFKGTTRFDISPAFALRGTVATGFRAPTLAESYYSATNVSPTSATVQLPANSAAAKILGFSNLKPERSTNYSIGTVIRPVERLTLTVDAYQVTIKDRILGTGHDLQFGRRRPRASGQPLNFPLVTHGGDRQRQHPRSDRYADRHQRLHQRRRYAHPRRRCRPQLPDRFRHRRQSVNWTVSGNYNQTKITRLSAAPDAGEHQWRITINQVPVFDLGAHISFVQTASPRVKVVASAFYSLDKFSATLRGYGLRNVVGDVQPRWRHLLHATGRLRVRRRRCEVNYKATHNIEFSIGANNILNKKPPSCSPAS